MKIGVISVTKQGDIIAEKLKESLAMDVFSKHQTEGFNMKASSKECMEKYNAVIYLASTGIAVRSIAPYIKSKDVDPAVIVIDCTGKYVISLLSGHLGGANELTIEIANIIGAQPIITTASDNMGFLAPDMLAKSYNLVIEDLVKTKNIAALLVDRKRVGFIDCEGRISCPVGYIDVTAETLKGLDGLVYVTNKEILSHAEVPINSTTIDTLGVELDTEDPSEGLEEVGTLPSIEADDISIVVGLYENTSKPVILRLIRRNIILGIGCRKNYDSTKMLEKVITTMKQYNLDIRAIKCIATVEVKKDEAAIIELTKTLKCPIDIWSLNDIKNIQHKYLGSDFVEKTIGVRAVCEPCVELSGGAALTEKLYLEGLTLCIGKYEGR